MHTWKKAHGSWDSADVRGSLARGAFYHFVYETVKHLQSEDPVNYKEDPVFTNHACVCLERPAGILKLLSARCRRGRHGLQHMLLI